MSILLSHHTICLVGIVVVLWAVANITILLIVRGGASCHCVGCVTARDIEKTPGDIARIARDECECPCHRVVSNMFPGMRCMDCYGLPCDEGTMQ